MSARPRIRSREPSDEVGARALRAVVYLGGTVAALAGLHTMAAGARAFPGGAPSGANVESELRFFGAIYAAFGVRLLRLAPQADRDARGLRAAAATIFAAGVARAGAWATVGRPHPGQQALLAIELLAPPAVVAWQARHARER